MTADFILWLLAHGGEPPTFVLATVSLDITQRFVNVQWAGDLAVVFGPQDEDAPKRDTLPK